MPINFQEMNKKKETGKWLSDDTKNKLVEFLNYMETLKKKENDPFTLTQDRIELNETFEKGGYAESIREILNPKDEESFNKAAENLNNLNDFFHKTSSLGISYYSIMVQAMSDELIILNLEDRKKKVDRPLAELNKALDLNMNLSDVEYDVNELFGWEDKDNDYKKPDEDDKDLQRDASELLKSLDEYSVKNEAPAPSELLIPQDDINVQDEEKRFKLEEPYSEEAINAYRIYFYNKEYITGLNGIKDKIATLASGIFGFKLDGDEDEWLFDDMNLKDSRYDAMVKAVVKLVKDLGDHKKDPTDIRESFIGLYETSINYYNAHCGIFWKPRKGTEGRIRLDIADKISDIIPNLVNTYNDLKRSVSYMEDKEHNAFGNLPYEEIKKEAEKFEKKYNFDIAPTGFKNKCIRRKGHKNLTYSEMEIRSQKQLEMKKIIKGFTKTFARNYEYTKDIDDYLTLKTKMSIKDMAKYYTAKKYLDKAYYPGATSNDLVDMVARFSKDGFKREYEALARNPAFITTMRQYRNKGFSKWMKFENKNIKNIKNIEDFKSELLNQDTEIQNKVAKKIEDFESELSQKAENKIYNRKLAWTRYVMKQNTSKMKTKEVARIIALQILTSPKGKKLVYGLINDGDKEMKKFEGFIFDYLVKKECLIDKNNNNNQITGIKVESIFDNNVLREDIIQEYNKELQSDMSALNIQPNNNNQNLIEFQDQDSKELYNKNGNVRDNKISNNTRRLNH